MDLTRPLFSISLGASDPHCEGRRLRQAGPVVPVELPGLGAVWAVTTDATARAAMTDSRLTSDIRCRGGSQGTGTLSDRDLIARPGNAGALHPHGGDYELMGRPLTAKQVEDLRPRIEAHVEQALDGLAAQPSGLVDLKEFFAYPLCLRILAERPSLPNLTAVSPLVPVSSTDGQPEAATAADADATSRLIVNAVRGLLRFPYQLELLTTGRYSWASAVKETLRWDPPVAHVLRYATEHLELEGALIRKGDPVLICLAAIGRDEAHFDAERFEITRSPNPNLGFGHGTHGCPGAPIALLIATVVLPALFTRFPRLARAPRAQGLPSMTVDTPQPCLVVVNAHLRDSLDEEIERLLRDV